MTRWILLALLSLVPATAFPQTAVNLVSTTVRGDSLWAYLRFDSVHVKKDTVWVTRVDTVWLPSSVKVDTGGSTLGISFGPYSGWGEPNTESFSLFHDATTAENILARITAARTKKVRLSLALMGGDAKQYLTDGKWDRAKWRARLQTYNTAEIKQAVAAAVADGTVLIGNVMDEPFNKKWGPEGTLTKAIVDGMCAETKVVFPTLPVGPTHDWRNFEPEKSYKICDYFLSQYRTSKGDVRAFRDSTLAIGKRDGHAIVFSLNILDGGKPDYSGAYDCLGTGGLGTYGNNCRMTPEQVREYGLVLGPAGCALTMWRYDEVFMAKTENQAAFKDIALFLSREPKRSCRRV